VKEKMAEKITDNGVKTQRQESKDEKNAHQH